MAMAVEMTELAMHSIAMSRLLKRGKRVLGHFLDLFGQANNVRHVYHRWTQHYRRRERTIANLTATFCVPTAEYDRAIQSESETTSLESFIELIRPDDVVWDIGANIGLYSVFAALAGASQSRVFSFEPSDSVRRLLEVNCKLNRLQGRITILPYALWHETSLLDFYEREEDSALNSLRPQTNVVVRPHRVAKVRAWQGDELIEKNHVTAPDVIKLDVEGAEFQVLKGLCHTLAKRPPRVVFCEVHTTLLPGFDATVQEVEELLLASGYQIRRIRDTPPNFHWIATQFSSE